MALPQLSPEERQANLKKAAEVRHARAELKARLKAGELTAAEVLEREDDVAKKTTVKAFLESLPGWGKVKAAKVMEELGIAEGRRLGGLGAKQREKLLEVIGE